MELNGPIGIAFFLFSPFESTKDKFRGNINLLVQDLMDNDVSLSKYVANCDDEIKTILPNSTVITSETLKNNSGDYQKIIYTGSQGGIYLEFEQYYWVKDNKPYVLTFTTETNKFRIFKKMGKEF